MYVRTDVGAICARPFLLRPEDWGDERKVPALHGFSAASQISIRLPEIGGARALLVSHWYVDSDAAVKLVTHAFAELTRDPAIGRAMVFVMNDRSRPKNWAPAAGPSVWAPFVVVGEGGAGR